MFTLEILIAFQEQIDSMKADLTTYYPDIKSSHRVEALARALGFKTYAALRANDLFSSPIQGEIDWFAFSSYLQEKGFQPTAKPLYLASGRAAIKLIMGEYPNLTYEGVGINTEHHKGETTQEYVERFRREREAMLLDSCVEEFLRAYSVVSRISKTRTITKKRGSYGLKHIAEKALLVYPDGEESAPSYVCNGSLIFAALNAGCYLKEIEGTQNAYFNMLQKSIDDLDCEIRPNGAVAQDRGRHKAKQEGRLWAA